MSGYPGTVVALATLVNVGAFLGFNGFALLIPSMRDALGLSHFQEGSLVTAVSISIMTTGFVSGMLASRYGARTVVLVGTLIGATGMALLGAAPNYPVAIGTSAIMGVGIQAAITPMMGLMSVWFDARNRGMAAGIASAGGGVSFVIMGAMVPWLTGRDAEDGWRHSWYFAAVVVLVSGMICAAFLRNRPTPESGSQTAQATWPMAAYRVRPVWLLGFLGVCAAWMGSLHSTFFGVYLEGNDVSLSTTARLWGLMGLVGIFSGIMWGRVADRLGRREAFFLSFVVSGIGIAVFWQFTTLAGLVVGVILLGLALRAAFTLCAAAAGDYVAPHMSSAVFGVTALGAGLGRSIGPPLGGKIADATGDLGWAMAIGVAGAAIGAVASLSLRRPRSA